MQVRDILIGLIIGVLVGLSGAIIYVNQQGDVNEMAMFGILIISVLGILSLLNLWINKDSWSETAFGLPRGTIRATIAILLVIMVFLSQLGRIELNTMPQWLLAIVGTIIGFYFGERKSQESNRKIREIERREIKNPKEKDVASPPEAAKEKEAPSAASEEKPSEEAQK